MKPTRLYSLVMILSALVSAVAALAAVPRTITYQGYLKDSAGVPVTAPTSIRFSLYSSNPHRNNLVWTETKSVTPTNGIYSTQLGSITPLTAPFDVPYWLGIKVAGDTEMPLQPLASAPYSLRSGVAESSAALSGQSLSQLDSRYINPADPVRLTTQQIALQNWQTRSVGSEWSFILGGAPSALVYDGNFVWAAFAGDGVTAGTVRKLSPATGYLSGSPITVGANPSALVFDGAYVWVANRGSDSVTRITAATGVVSGTFTTNGNGPAALTWDGTSIWVANASSNNIVRINPTTGAAIGSPILAGTTPVALAYDGTAIWAANYGSNNVTRILAATGVRDTEYAVGTAPVALAYYPVYGYLLVVNNGSNSITQINKSTYDTTTYSVPASPNAILINGVEWWLASGTGVGRYEYPSTLQGTFNNGHIPTALTYDGTNLWIAYKSYGSITRLDNVGVSVGAATVGSVQLQENAVTTSKLAASSVTANKLNLDGDLHLNDHNLYLRPSSDINHGLGWYGTGKTFATAAPDGPVLYGYSGGALGSYNGTTQKIALRWNNSGNVGIGTVTPGEQLEITGNLRLPATTATSGIIKSGTNTLLHTYGGDANFFAGVLAGNLTMGGSSNTGLGNAALNANTSGYDNTAAGTIALRANSTGYDNTAVGAQALGSNTTGDGNTAVGSFSLGSNTTGRVNTASGFGALFRNTVGWLNTATGESALFNNTSGTNNTAVGASTLSNNTTGSENTAIGSYALAAQSFSYGGTKWDSYNTAVGSGALYNNAPTDITNGIRNTALGAMALQSNTTGAYNTATGTAALKSNQTGNYNTADGYMSLQNNSTGIYNTATGGQSLFNNSTGQSNTAHGYNALYSNTAANNNTAIGTSAMYGNTNGHMNTAVGMSALYGNTTGNENTAIGMNALYTQSYSNNGAYWASYNTAVGSHALYYNAPTATNNGINNTALGAKALQGNTTGARNTAAGASSLAANESGTDNTATGNAALISSTSGSSNTANGASALYGNTSGIHNSALGFSSLYANSSGHMNTAIGTYALNNNTTGSNNTAIGYDADVAAGNFTNATVIGSSAVVNASNKVRIGNSSVTVIEGQVGWSYPSDVRLKKDVHEISKGLDLITSLRPVEYELIDGNGRKDFGFIAQEIEGLIGNEYNVLGIGEDADRTLSLRYTDFIAPMVKAMQEQQALIEAQGSMIKELKAELETLKQTVDAK